jgi:TP53 regulating kinase-like protein
VRCRKEGVRVPGVLAAGVEEGWLVLEWVGGKTVRGVLDDWAHSVEESRKNNADSADESGMLSLMSRVGLEVGKLHNIGVCHGDLTTSNLMLSPPSPPPSHDPSITDSTLIGNVYLIDFGLTTASIQDEDKAVDLYVLERAFAATHPAAEPLFQEVLRAYGESYKGARGVLKRLEGVRMRGRKRSMLG